VNLPFDPVQPPADPPAGCDVMVWRLAYQLHLDHLPAPDAFCAARTCRERFTPWPCDPSRLAAQGFLGAVGAWAGLDADRPANRWNTNPRGGR
jgi:hypothetical protein